MKKFFNRTGAACLGLLILTLLEGLLSTGQFLKFEEYNAFAWIVQGMAVYVTIWVSVNIADTEL